ncbi:MAG: four helix bundle protein [Bacteroidetes bacterium]|nr:four helix bundle protein [Bacteroidota bacterium]
MSNEEKNLIVDLTFEFSLLIIDYTEELEKLKKNRMAWQLFDAGTSVGANVNESQNAESRADFIHKMKIAAKEGSESHYWLRLCKHSKNYPACDDLLERIVIINKILTKIISSSKK